MAVKKNVFDNYIKAKKRPVLNNLLEKKTKYTHNRAFDRPSTIDEQPSQGKATYAHHHKIKSLDDNSNTERGNNKGLTNGIQTDNKGLTNGIQTDNKGLTNGIQTDNKKLEVDPVNDISLLAGLQFKVILEIYKSCKKNASTTTKKLSLNNFVTSCQSTKNAIKVTISRLKNKGCFSLYEQKLGRAGWVKYNLSKKLYDSILECENNLYTGGHLSGLSTERDKERLTTPTYSSSRSINTTTTNLIDWEKIDLTSIQHAFKTFDATNPQTFGRKQLKTIAERAGHFLSVEEIQRSLEHFAFGIETLRHDPNSRYAGMKSPAGLLFKQLCAGDPWDEPQYLTPEEQGLKQVFDNVLAKLMAERKKYFFEWVKTDRDKKYAYYESTIPSTHFYDDRRFVEMAKIDFDKNHWVTIQKSEVLAILGGHHQALIDRFFKIKHLSEKKENG